MKHVSTIIILAILILPISTNAWFSRSLSSGDTGLDVKDLQIALNNIPGIQVSAFGPGSPNNETDFFGAKTRQAVTAFQNMYASEVLYPIGLSTGTGYFGVKTRAKLNSLLTQKTAQQSYEVEIKEEDLTVKKELVKKEELIVELLEPVAATKNVDIDEMRDTFEAFADSVASGELDLDDMPDFNLGLNKSLPSPDGKPFGGPVVYYLECNCSEGYWLIIGPPMGGPFHFLSQTYRENNMPKMAAWTVGLYKPGGNCKIVVGDSCVKLPTIGKIDGFIGSSK